MKTLYTLLFWMFTTITVSAHPASFAPLAEKTLPAVVSIYGEDSKLGEGAGSGFIYDKNGHIITNNHVVHNMKNITVILENGTEYKAKVIGTDPLTDLAVIKIDTKNQDLPILKLGNSDNIYVGDWVVAIGNPFRLGGTVTKGIVSARSRDIQQGLYDDYIQTDAPINQGNSGGPLINMQGDVVGINTMIISPSRGSIGLGFAIPSNLVKFVSSQLIKNGRVIRGWLGVSFERISPEIAESIDLESTNGTLITSVQKDGPAQKGGIQAGDVILEIGKTKITRKKRLPGIIAMSPIGEKIPLKVWRKGKTFETHVVLVERNTDLTKIPQGFGYGNPDTSAYIDSFGIEVSNITDTITKRFNLNPKVKGVVITAHAQNDTGNVSRKFLPLGAVIVMINNIEIKNVNTVQKVISDAKKRKKRTVMFMLETPNGARLITTLPLK